MQKLIALVLSINLILFTNLPLLAGGGKTIIRVLPSALGESAARQAARAGVRSTMAGAAAQQTVGREILSASSQHAAYQIQQFATRQLADVKVNLQRGIAQAQLTEILKQPLFKGTGINSPSQIPATVTSWKKSIAQLANQLAEKPELFTAEKLFAEKSNAAGVKQYNQSLQKLLSQIAAVGIFGTEKDAASLYKVYQKTADTPAAELVTTATARALLRLKAYDTLAQLAEQAPQYAVLWNGIGRLARERNLPIEVETQTDAFVPSIYTPLLIPAGRLTAISSIPFYTETAWYMDLGRAPAATEKQPAAQALAKEPAKPAQNTVEKAETATPETAEIAQTTQSATTEIPLLLPPQQTAGVSAEASWRDLVAEPVRLPISYAPQAYAVPKRLTVEDRFGGSENFQKMIAQVRAFLQSPAFQEKLKREAMDKSTPLQRASLYTASFVIGLEIGTPIIASLGSALGLSLEENILVTVATYFPYSVGAFFTNWLMGKIGRKATMNIGLTLMGGSFLAGASLLGLDGAFSPWGNTLTHYWSILSAITAASLGGVLIHNAAGPVMTEISKNASELVLQKRGARVELARAGGMLSSFAFPFIATSMLGMDWSAPFLMALPFVGAAALGLNLAKLPNSKPIAVQAPKTQVKQSLAQALKNNKYIRLFKEDKSVAPLLGGLFIMNGVEMAYNSGFLFLLPSLTNNPSSQYLFGLTQFALPFVLGRYMAGKFLEWFPKHNLSVATGISALGGIAATGLSHNVYALTAALFTAEMGISTAFTLAFARTAKNTLTQDRITSLIIASAISCALGPVLLTSVAQQLIDGGLLGLQDATAAAMIGIPSLLAMWSAGLFKKVERLTSGNFSEKVSSILKKLRNIFPHRNTSIEE